jgi:vacuolar protein sorting-associated protein 45
MARFVDNYPEYKKMQGNVSKHVTLVTEMSKLVEARKLMTVSQTEQDLACNGGQGAAYEAVTDLLNNESVSDIDRLRLVMLYALRYEKENPVQLMQLFNKLASRSPKYKPGLVQFLLKQAGVEKRTGDLFGNRDLLNIARNMARGLKGVENVYTQHQPLLFQTMESITRGRLRDVDYPFVGDHFQQGRYVPLIFSIS